MNRRSFLGLIPGGVITAALAFLGLRKTEISGNVTKTILTPNTKWTKPDGVMSWRHGFDDTDFLQKAKQSGLSLEAYNVNCLIEYSDERRKFASDSDRDAIADAMASCGPSGYIVAGVDPASPDGGYAAVVTMEQMPDGWIVTDWEEKA